MYEKTGLKGLLACAAAIIALSAVMLPAGVLAAGTDGARSGGLITVKGADGADPIRSFYSLVNANSSLGVQ